ncbi:MAG: T9SS type A sorting domain-containing protein [Bacteroidia bacterium]
MKNRIIVFLFLIIVSASSLKATVWTTVSTGYWNDPAIWSAGIVPLYSTTDTFDIQHYIVMEDNLSFNTGSQLVIESTGGICGHHNITINANVPVVKYGILEIDTLLVNGGQVNCYAPGRVTLTCAGIVTGAGAYFVVNGCSMFVGPWFDCVQPEYSFTLSAIEEQNENTDFDLFPNPNDGSFVLSLHQHFSDAHIMLIDLTGRIVLLQAIPGNEGDQAFNAKGISPGLYMLILSEGQKQISTKKIVIE